MGFILYFKIIQLIRYVYNKYEYKEYKNMSPNNLWYNNNLYFSSRHSFSIIINTKILNYILLNLYIYIYLNLYIKDNNL